jgi:hypothetical protein
MMLEERTNRSGRVKAKDGKLFDESIPAGRKALPSVSERVLSRD